MMRPGRIAALMVLAAVGVLGIAAFLVPFSAFRKPLEAAASAALGRDVRIGGSIHLAVYPQLGLSLKEVTIANIAGGREPQMITVGKIFVGAQLTSLLSGRVHVTRVVLKKPVVHLEIGDNGLGNWQPTPGETAQHGTSAFSVSIHRVNIENGEVTYFDARTRGTKTLGDVSLLLTMPTVATSTRPLRLDGTATYNSVALKLEAELDDFQGLLRGLASKARLGFRSDLFNLAFSGEMIAPSSSTGHLDLQAPSLRQLAAWAGETLPPGNGFGRVTIVSAISAKDGVYAVSGADITLDGMKLSGDLAIDTRAGVPLLKGTLAVDHLNLIPYLAPGSSQDLTTAAAKATRDTPLALGGLNSVNGDLTLTIEDLIVPDFKIDRTTVVAALRGGVLKAELNSIAAYGGTGKGVFSVDTTQPIPSVRETLEMNNIRAEQFLGQAGSATRVKAVAAVRFDVAARGQTETDMIKSVSGRGSINLVNGSIAGVDLGAVARLLQSSTSLLGGALGDAAVTHFTALGASFTVQSGVLRTNDLRMVGPTLEMTGTGSVNLASRQIEFHLDPRTTLAVASLKLADIGVPFYVRGSWENPSYEPDPAGLTQGIAGTVGSAVGNAAALPKKVLSVPGALKSLFDNGR